MRTEHRPYRVMIAACLVALFVPAGEGIAVERRVEGSVDEGPVIFSTSTLRPVGNDYVPKRDEIVRDIRCKLARDEFETFQIGVHALEADLHDIGIDVRTDLPAKVYHRTEGSRVALVAGDTLDTIKKGKSGRFWVTLHALADLPAKPDGKHVGTIRITTRDGRATDIPLRVTVRPFVLPRARISFGMYSGRNVARHVFDAVEEVGSDYEHRTPDSFGIPRFIKACYEDMRDHGHTSATLPGICHWYRPDGTVELDGSVVAQFAELLLESRLVTPGIPVHMDL